MKKFKFRFISLANSIALIFLLIVPAFASSESEYVQKTSFFHWVNEKAPWLEWYIGYGWGMVCPESEDGYHRSSSTLGRHVDSNTGELTDYYDCICTYCGATFTAYESDLQQSYAAQVEELPAPNYNSSGQLRWRLSVSAANSESSTKVDVLSSVLGTDFSCVVRRGKGTYSYFRIYFDGFSAPLLGNYTLYMFYFSPDGNVYPNNLGGSYRNFYICYCNISNSDYGALEKPVNGKLVKMVTRGYAEGEEIVGENAYSEFNVIPQGEACSLNCYWEIVFTPIPASTGSYQTAYNITTRPTSITGNYGIIGDNGQITQVEDNSTIVNETNNTYYNPATGTTSPITDWSYNYADRSYTVTTETGDTVTVTYGDENITIKEGDTTYNVYYISPGSGSETPGPSPSPSPSPSPTPAPCAHDWQPGDTEPVLPTCTRDGSALYTCSICGETKTEVLPAPGHSWQVKQSVSTQYDESGTLIQEGYTLYECTVCQEQYKDTDGAGPPQPPGQEKESIWEKIGKLLGSIFGGFVGLIEAALGKVLDALTALCEMLMEKLGVVVETILSVLDEVPKLFGGFLDFLSAVFPFLPPELMLLLTFGVIAIVVIGIIKALRR